jgi:hypothetical protein
MAYELHVVAPPQPASALGRFLAAHNLRSGIGDYWSASIVTVESKGAVDVRPVVTDPQGRLVRWDKNSLDSWYGAHTFQFLVYNLAVPFGGVGQASAVKTYGTAARTYDFGTYQVLVWAHPVVIVGAET